jgi:hypothetical protein
MRNEEVYSQYPFGIFVTSEWFHKIELKASLKAKIADNMLAIVCRVVCSYVTCIRCKSNVAANQVLRPMAARSV